MCFGVSGVPFQTNTSVNCRNSLPTKDLSYLVVLRSQQSICRIIIDGYHLFGVALRWLGFVTWQGVNNTVLWAADGSAWMNQHNHNVSINPVVTSLKPIKLTSYNHAIVVSLMWCVYGWVCFARSPVGGKNEVNRDQPHDIDHAGWCEMSIRGTEWQDLQTTGTRTCWVDIGRWNDAVEASWGRQ